MDGWRVVENMLWRWRDARELELPPEVVAAALAFELQPNPQLPERPWVFEDAA